MLSSQQKFDHNKFGDGLPPNFRTFDQGGYSSSSITEEVTGRQSVVYSMISIFNSLFSRYESVEHMMRQTVIFFSNPAALTPIFYLNSSELQRITEDWMFPHLSQTRSDPIKNAEKKWIDKFQKSEAELQREGQLFSHQILAWKKILTLSGYNEIHKFVSALLLPQVILAELFPQAQPTLLQSLSTDIASLAPQTQEVVQNFIEHNTKNNKKPSESTIDLSLYLYLAQEFSVFLMLAKLDTLQLIQEAFSLSLPISISGEHRVRPILTYPISAAKDRLAEKTLSAFLKVQEIYHQYYEQLELPLITEKLILVDSLVPREVLAKKERNRSNQQSVAVVPLESEKILSTKSLSPLSSCRSLTFHNQEEQIHPAVKIYKKFIDNHSKTLKVSYRNGVTCDIAVSNEDQNDSPEATEEQVLDMIESAIQSVLNDETMSIEVTFCYKANLYKLSAQSSLQHLVKIG